MGSADFPALPEWSDRIAEFLAGRLTPEPARLAATVVLLRPPADGASGAPEIYLLKRATTMSFAGGRYAFPGGRVDPRDSDASVAWAGPSAEEWGARFGCSAADARALVCAAVRELFEETGVLFAGPSPTSVVESTADDEWEADRRALETRELSLSELLTRRSLVLRTDLLGAWSRWVTPEFEPRRYDTAFFVASLPPGQHARDVSGEADTTVWTSAAQAIADHAAGTVSMLPPTITTLRQLAAFPSAAAALAAAPDRSLMPIIAGVEQRPDGFWLVWPIDLTG
ncbi:NUDIX domain-containing protein [Actinospica sp. MGRD01-02]|uniref:NUDIX domain-containing protein n=1 Tax=Actinospica acidithermotolerans TaxID=2828514 RepID=A0A941II69_9ACTN|nr:NUDIX domain-containing protein [Actinospica acidithermotolerans]MBR7826467.1 NUDIX domain-containing protein [Actinospica acidithermotolerans]